MSHWNEDNELQKAIAMSEETFAAEQVLRKQAKELEEEMQRRRKAKWGDAERYSTLMNLMEWQALFVSRSVGCGIRNLGNSCFMNATLQCLAYTPAFSQMLCQSTHSQRCRSKSFCALCEMEKVLPLILMGKEIVTPRNLFMNLPRINDLLNPGCQEDAHEFLQSLLDRMEMAYDDEQRPHRKKDPQNPIRNLFVGSTKTAIQCAKCKRRSVTKEPFCCISLDIDKTDVDLAEALEIFTRDELLRGEEKYFCSHCGRKRVAHKRLTLCEIPPILVMHFKRFSVQFQSAHHKQGTMKKMAAHVEFPEVLDFKDLSDVIFEEDRQTALIDSEYELFAVLVHSGPQLGYGHYYALIKSPDNYWFRMNDMEIIPVNTKHVLREQGYIVFYRRRTNNLMKCHLKRIKASKSNSSSSSDDEDSGDRHNHNHDRRGRGKKGRDESKEDNDAMDISSAEMSPFGNSKLTTMSVEELQSLRREFEGNIKRLSKFAENPRNQKRSKTVREAQEEIEVARARIQEVDAYLNANGRGTNGLTVDTELLTDDYFANNCNDPMSSGSMVMVEEVEAHGMESLSLKGDRSAYVHVPPMATRPEMLGDAQRQWSGNGSAEAVEVFWPLHDIH